MTRDAKRPITWRQLFELAAVTVCTVALVFTVFAIARAALLKNSEGTRDYVEYWASGQLLVRGQDPYDSAALLKIERTVGFPDGMAAMVMGNPPPALLLTYPLGFLEAKHGEWVWMLLLLGSLAGSVYLTAHALATRESYVKILGCSFAPALACIVAGQMALFVLLGAAAFLSCYRTRPLVAGAALWLCLLKPQLFLPFGLVLAVWVFRNRQFRVLAGLVSTVTVSVALISWLDPHCWVQYHEMMRHLRYDQADIPCLSVVLRNAAGGSALVQYLPALLGSAWALTYYWRRRNKWDWWEHGSPLLLVSLLVPPYTWFIDQCLAIPALMRGLTVTRSRKLIAVLALMTAIIEIGPFVHVDQLHSKLYLWTTPAWLAWYIVATRSTAGQDERTDAAENRVLETAQA